MTGGFGGRRVVAFESRRAPEMASLIERHGGLALTAPTMREVLRERSDEATAFAARLRDGGCDVLVLMTGVGTRALVRAIAGEMSAAELGALLVGGRARVVVRGPKPAAALREIGVRDFLTVHEPNTWREVLEVLEREALVAGKRIDVQEYGVPTDELYRALAERGASVSTVPVYRWALPEDTAPLRAALHELAAGRVDVALFTSRAQVEHALLVAREEGVEDAVRRALGRALVASIGPICSEGLRAEGIEVDLEPSHPKMGHLVKESAERSEQVLEAKRSGT